MPHRLSSRTMKAWVEKRGRITPFNGAALPEGEIPAFQSPEAAKKADDEAKKADAKKLEPSTGVNVLERMGAELPALPQEKAVCRQG